MDLRIQTQLGPGTNHIFCYLGLDMAGPYSDLALAIPNCFTENLSYFWWKLWHSFFWEKKKKEQWHGLILSLEKWNLQQFFLGSKFHESWKKICKFIQFYNNNNDSPKMELSQLHSDIFSEPSNCSDFNISYTQALHPYV